MDLADDRCGLETSPFLLQTSAALQLQRVAPSLGNHSGSWQALPLLPSPLLEAGARLVAATGVSVADPNFMKGLATWAGTFAVGSAVLTLLFAVFRFTKAPKAHQKTSAPPAAAHFGWPLLLAELVTAMTTFAEGYDMAVMGGALHLLVKDLSLSPSQSAWVVGIVQIMMAIGAPFGGWLGDRIGRLPGLALSYALMTAGPVLMFFAHGFVVLFLGRVIQALGMGAAVTISTTYVTEVSPASIRGSLPSLTELFMVLGLVVAFFTNFALVGAPGGWRWMLVTGAVFPALVLPMVLAGLPPESPRYLLMSGQRHKAKAVLRSLVDSEEAAETIARWDEEQEPETAASWLQTLWPEDPRVRRAFFTGVVAMVIQLACGVNVITSYAATMLADEVGKANANFDIFLVACERLFVVIPAVFFIDFLGRRPVLLGSSMGMAIAMILLTIFYWAGAEVYPWKYAGFAFFYMAFSPGVGAVSWVFVSEVMDNAIRSKGLAVAIFAARVLTGVEMITFPAAKDHLGTGAVFLILAVFNVAAWFFYFFFVPETTGVKLESVKRCFEREAG